jgi:hypothetical protein
MPKMYPMWARVLKRAHIEVEQKAGAFHFHIYNDNPDIREHLSKETPETGRPKAEVGVAARAAFAIAAVCALTLRKRAPSAPQDCGLPHQ